MDSKIRFLLTGHIDHGKSTLGGHLLYKCNVIDKREAQRIFTDSDKDKMSSFKYARLLDTGKDEMEKGVTIEYNEINFTFKDIKYKLIDTPGHKIYVRNLIDAIYKNQVEAQNENKILVGVLVLSVIPNELESSIISGQVKEDLLLLRAAGITSLIICINKMDKLSWNRMAFDDTKKKIYSIIRPLKFKHINCCATSGLYGHGITERSHFEDIACLMDMIYEISYLSTSEIKIADCGEIKTISSVNFDLEVCILNCPVLSAGYSGILHNYSGDYTYHVEKIKSANKRSPFLKTSERGIISISFDFEVIMKDGEKVILRNNNTTVGYGIVKL